MMKRNATYRKGWLAGVALIVLTTLGAAATPAVSSSAAADSVAHASTDTSNLLTDITPTPIGGTPARDSLWAQANAAYSNGQFRLAVQLYDELLRQGVHSSKLYYNLGNSWFKQERMGKAILNYSRALLLDPTDEDTQYNLDMANVRIVDKIDVVPEFFLKTWFRKLGQSLNSDTWAVMGLVFLGITFAAVILWLLARKLSLRKLGFYTGMVALILCIVSTLYAQSQRTRLLHSDEAIVMNLVAPVKSAPAAGSKDIFVLHEGTKVRMLEQLDGWTEIILADGNKGWIASNAIEAVVPEQTQTKGGE